ncbi:hypothetical protein JKF63_07002 [Porcisia hertigi]|uniref:Uncharacterized protein n=1 Tax=Porcisia hertigi TaxID=2761500 RepID=A0A836IEW3_9TRYP|nr:hypothetical protein JKF63_07002 [Porcisia hertigi]
MTALVLCDGTEGCLRSIEVACASHVNSASPASPQEASVVLAHVWNAKESSTGAANANNSAVDRDAPGRSAGDTKAAAAPSASAGGHVSRTMCCADVLTTTLRHIHTNKYLKNKLHYVVETACASALCASEGAGCSAVADATAAPAGSAAAPPAAHGKAGQTQRRTSSSAHRHAGLRPVEKQAGTAVGAPAGDGGADNGTAREKQEAAVCVPENEERALVIAKYAAARAAHHHAAAILLGVGQRQDGKVCTVGAVAKRVLFDLRGAYPLYYVKKDGAKWRPGLATAAATAAATPLRFTIVVPVPTDTECEPAVVAKMGAGEEAAALQVPKRVQAAVAAAVQYVQTRCVRHQPTGQVDQITFAVIATSSLQTSGGTAEPVHGAGGDAAAAPDAGSACASHLESYKRYLEALPVLKFNPRPPEDAEATPAGASASPIVAEAGEVTGQKGLGDGAAGVGAGESAKTLVHALRAEAPAVAVCVLKAPKKSPLLSLDLAPEVALPQIVKQVSALRPDVLVMPTSLVPDSIQLALLATSNPHCIVLPV